MTCGGGANKDVSGKKASCRDVHTCSRHPFFAMLWGVPATRLRRHPACSTIQSLRYPDPTRASIPPMTLQHLSPRLDHPGAQQGLATCCLCSTNTCGSTDLSQRTLLREAILDAIIKVFDGESHCSLTLLGNCDLAAANASDPP